MYYISGWEKKKFLQWPCNFEMQMHYVKFCHFSFRKWHETNKIFEAVHFSLSLMSELSELAVPVLRGKKVTLRLLWKELWKNTADSTGMTVCWKSVGKLLLCSLWICSVLITPAWIATCCGVASLFPEKGFFPIAFGSCAASFNMSRRWMHQKSSEKVWKGFFWRGKWMAVSRSCWEPQSSLSQGAHLGTLGSGCFANG